MLFDLIRGSLIQVRCFIAVENPGEILAAHKIAIRHKSRHRTATLADADTLSMLNHAQESVKLADDGR